MDGAVSTAAGQMDPWDLLVTQTGHGGAPLTAMTLVLNVTQ